MRTSSPYPMISVAEATDEIQSRVAPLPPIVVGFREALGYVLAEDAIAPMDLPPAERSAVDGYALVAQPGPLSLRVLRELTAGQSADLHLDRETAVRIMTGGVIPPGADAVVMVEETEERDGVVTVRSTPKVGDNIQGAGIDVHQGQAVLVAGRRLGPPEIGMLATIGQTRVKVHPKPRVAVMATGDEVVEPEEEPPVGYVRDSNRYAVIAAATEAGGEVVWSRHVPDDPAALADAMRDALSVADVLITSGGVSMGTRDHIKPLLAELGDVHFGRIAFKPGKPLTFASFQRPGRVAYAFGLPGFPVSSLVTFEVFVRPALRRLQGYANVQRPRVRVTLAHDIQPDAGRLEYHRATVRWQDGTLLATSTGKQTSSRLITMVGANALLEVPSGTALLPAGTELPALLTGDLQS
ncbi:MAG: molybdopterin molybdotransferase MoeA [Chloroflexi bacterium]|nr:molybdopterin molybdotransferase MoeA [Chloroflexota bacterium]